MKALSFTRPWDELVLSGAKTIENRTWSTSYRGPLLVHAAQSWNGLALDFANIALASQNQPAHTLAEAKADHPLGYRGLVVLTGSCDRSVSSSYEVQCPCGPWAEPGVYHWQVSSPVRLAEPVPGNGQLGLWTPKGEHAERLLEALALVGRPS